jgi:hypothetical protein
VVTMGLAGGVGRLVAWIGRRRLASDAGRHCREVEQFTHEMACALERLADELGPIEPGLAAALPKGVARLRELHMWFLEEDYRAFVLGRRRASPAAIHQGLGEWVVEPLRQALDATRKAVGRRLYDESHSAIRRRLNERIRGTENELVESASRLLHADVARPGERARGRWQRLGVFLRRLVLGILAVSALLVICAHSWSFKGRTRVRTPPVYLREQNDCGEWDDCNLSKTRHAAPTSQRGAPDARGDRRRDRTWQATGLGRAGSRGAF